MPNEHPLTDLVPGLTVGVLDRPGRQLRWLTAGQGEPPILLVSGAGETALDWLPILPSTASLSTVIAPDRAGLGLSDPAGRLSAQCQVDDLIAVLDQIGPAVVVGHSWGGLLVQLATWQQPESVAGLVLIDPSHEELSAALSWRLRLAVAAMEPALVLAHLVGLFPGLARPSGRKLAALCTTQPDLQAAIEDAYLRSYRRRRQVAMIGKENRLGQASIAYARRARASLRAPDVPLIVLTATTGKSPALQEQSTRLHAAVAAGVPRGRHILVENSGHYVHHDQPDVVVEAIAEVLAEVRHRPDH